MSRRFLLIPALVISLAGTNLMHAQDASAADPAAPASDDMATLKAQNAALKKEVADASSTITKLQAQLSQAGVTPAATVAIPPPKALPIDAPGASATAASAPAAAGAVPGAPATPGAPAADAGPSRSYTVVKGDSYWKIAHKMYPGDTSNGVEKLKEANKDAVGTKPLKIGQVLVVP